MPVPNPKDVTVEAMARVVYAAIREWCIITHQPVDYTWADLPVKYKNHLINAVSEAFHNMKTPTGKQLHETCLKQALEGGWKYGEKVDRPNRVHPDILPWEKLSFNQRMKDHLFSVIIRAFLEGS